MKIKNNETYKIEFIKDVELTAEHMDGEEMFDGEKCDYFEGEKTTVEIYDINEKDKTVSLCSQDSSEEKLWHRDVPMDSFKALAKQIITWQYEEE